MNPYREPGRTEATQERSHGALSDVEEAIVHAFFLGAMGTPTFSSLLRGRAEIDVGLFVGVLFVLLSATRLGFLAPRLARAWRRRRDASRHG